MRIRPLPVALLGVALLLAGLWGCPGTTPGGSTAFNLPPEVVITADVTRGIAPLTVKFGSSGSTDDGLIVARLWGFGDGATSPDISPSHTFQTTGVYRVLLTLTDDQGATATGSLTIYVTQAPVAVIVVDRTSAPSAPALFQFDARQSYDPDGTIVRYQWDFDDGTRELVATTAHTFASPGTYRVRLTVTDDSGVTGSKDQTIAVGIATPEVIIRNPPPDITNLAVSIDSPLWVYIDFGVQPGVPRFVRAGLDGDRDPCSAQAVSFDTASGQRAATFAAHTAPVTGVAYSADGAWVLTSGQDGSVRLYDAASGELWRTPDVDAAGPITALDFAPGGTRYVYATGDGRLVIRERESGNIVREIVTGAAVQAVAFSRDITASQDGTRLAAGGASGVPLVYDAAGGALLQTLDGILPDGTPTGHTGAVTAIAFSPVSADMVLTGSTDRTAKLWRVEDGLVLRTYAGHTDAVNGVAFEPEALFVLTGSTDKTARIWNLFTAELTRTFTHPAAVRSVAYAPDGLEVLAGTADGSARIWNVATGDTTHVLTPCSSPIVAVAFSPDGERALLGVAAQSDIRLDSNPSAGEDLNLTIPTALDLHALASVRGPAYPGTYYLWVELDTDRTEPTREYAAATIHVVRPFTPTITADTPRVPLIGDEVAVLVAPSSRRQIFDLGSLRAGDRIFLSLLTTPGYGEAFEADVFSVMILDTEQKVFAWYQDGFVQFSRDTRLMIGHDSPNYYIVTEGCAPPVCADLSLAQSVAVRIERGFGVFPRPQRLFLDLDGAAGVRIDGLPATDLPPLNAAAFNPLWGPAETQTIKSVIVNRLNTLFGPYAVDVYTSDGPPPPLPYETIYFGQPSFTPLTLDPFGISAYIDPRNETQVGAALVFTESVRDGLAFAVPGFSAGDVGVALGNEAGRLAGHLLGLRHTEGGPSDLLDPLASAPWDSSLNFRVSPLYRGEQYNGQIGIQDAPQILLEVIGPRP